MASKKPITKKNTKLPINPVTGLTGQQEAFAREYLMPQGKDAKPFNGTQAAIAAGYSPKTAASQASRMLNNVKVQALLSELQAPALAKFEVTQDRIMSEISNMAFSNILDFVTIHEGQAWIDLSKCTREQASALAAFEVIELPPFKMVQDGEEVVREVLKVKVKLWDKWPALEMLARRHDLVKPVAVDINHSGTVKVENGELARRVAFMLRKAVEDQKAAAASALAKQPDKPVELPKPGK